MHFFVRNAEWWDGRLQTMVNGVLAKKEHVARIISNLLWNCIYQITFWCGLRAEWRSGSVLGP